jgi:hypothetical protein
VAVAIKILQGRFVNRPHKKIQDNALTKKILTVVGARPQFIKVSPVSHAIREHGNFSEVLVHTGQHYDDNMSRVFFDELRIAPPRYNLDVGSGGHGEQTGEMLKRLEPIMVKERPGLMLIYGDTCRLQAAYTGCTCRGGPALVQQENARGDQQGRRRPSVVASVLSHENGG